MDRPARFDPEFVKPDKSVMRRHRAKKPAKLFETAELRGMIDGADVEHDGNTLHVQVAPELRAMILLGVNCGFGNMDCAELQLSAANLETGWIDFPRPKTGIGRRCPLWPETVDAIQGVRGKPGAHVSMAVSGRAPL